MCMSAADTEARKCTITVPPLAKNGDKLKLTIRGQKEKVIVTLKDTKPGESITFLLPEAGKAGRAWLTDVPEESECCGDQSQENYSDTCEETALRLAEAAQAQAQAKVAEAVQSRQPVQRTFSGFGFITTRSSPSKGAADTEGRAKPSLQRSFSSSFLTVRSSPSKASTNDEASTDTPVRRTVSGFLTTRSSPSKVAADTKGRAKPSLQRSLSSGFLTVRSSPSKSADEEVGGRPGLRRSLSGRLTAAKEPKVAVELEHDLSDANARRRLRARVWPSLPANLFQADQPLGQTSLPTSSSTVSSTPSPTMIDLIPSPPAPTAVPSPQPPSSPPVGLAPFAELSPQPPSSCDLPSQESQGPPSMKDAEPSSMQDSEPSPIEDSESSPIDDSEPERV